MLLDAAAREARLALVTDPFELRVALLGSFEVRFRGQDVTEALVGRSRTVFQYLLLAGGAVPRDVLIDVCWPEFDVERGRNNLNVAITGIRRAFGCRDVVRHSCGAYRVNPELATWIDVDQFTEAVRAAHELDGDGYEALALARYRSAVALYGGELLPEARYSDWVEPRRRFLCHAYLDTLKRLAVLCRDNGHLFEAAWTAQLGLLVDDLDEELVESWLQTLADRRATRQLRAALTTYSARLEEELGVTPEPRLVALADLRGAGQ